MIKAGDAEMANIANQLHNNHNVYILGAGFSKFRGLPLINDFMTQMRDALEYHGRLGHASECEAIEAVLEFRLKASAAAYRVQIDLENIEELFSLASASPSTIEESIKLAIAATLDFARNSTEYRRAQFKAQEYSFPVMQNWMVQALNASEDTCSAPAYEYIVRALLGQWVDVDRTGENSFITFNYDTLLEEALEAMQIEYSLGFNEIKRKKNSKDVNIFKLHGSINWAIPKNSRTKIEVFQDYRAVVDAGLSPQVIPPTWKKDSRGVFDEIWKGSLEALSDATRVVVIGFSIPPTDLHFKYLLAAGLKENYSLREIVFVNPGDGMNLVKKRCQKLFANQTHNAAKLRFIPSTVESFTGQGTGSNHVASISRPLPESFQNLQF